jgi:hypothetical protein
VLKKGVQFFGVGKSDPDSIGIGKAQQTASERRVQVKHDFVRPISEAGSQLAQGLNGRGSSSDNGPRACSRLTGGRYGNRDDLVHRRITFQDRSERLLNDPSNVAGWEATLDRMNQRQCVDYVPERTRLHNEYSFA